MNDTAAQPPDPPPLQRHAAPSAIEAVRTTQPEESPAAERQAAQREIATAKLDTSTVALVTLAGLAVFYTLYVAASIILPLLLALVLTLLLLPGKRLLVERLRLPAALAALLLILALFAVLASGAYALSLPATAWLAKLPQTFSTMQHKLGFVGTAIEGARHGMERMSGLLQGGAAASSGSPPPGGPSPPAHAAQPAAQSSGAAGFGPGVSSSLSSSLGGVGLTLLEGTRAAMGQLLTLVVVLFFTLAFGDSLLRRAVEVLPSFGEKRRMVEIASEIERNISGYLLTITVMNLFTGTANFLQMWLQGFPDPLLWGALAFLLNYIPILGPFTGIVLFFLVGLFVKSGIWAALLPPIIYLGVHVLEGESITPMLLARRFTLNPVLVIVALFFWDWMWGVLGAFLAVPLLAITKIVCDHIPALTPLGHILGAPGKRHRRT